MTQAVLYEYDQRFYTIPELSVLSGISESVLRKRLRSGWTVKDAVEIRYEPKYTRLDEHLRGKLLKVLFEVPLASVYQEMQPALYKPYTAIPNERKHGNKEKDYYLIQLESGKPLIVYPNEFTVLGIIGEEPLQEKAQHGTTTTQHSGEENKATE